MDNDKKNLLMQYLFRFAEHYELSETPLTSFKKRAELLDKLKVKEPNAWNVMNNLFEAFIKSDRIVNDKEKFDKARVLWDAEHAAAEHDKVNAEMLLVQFCKENAIPVGSLAVQN
jgi:hypothetical protein